VHLACIVPNHKSARLKTQDGAFQATYRKSNGAAAAVTQAAAAVQQANTTRDIFNVIGSLLRRIKLSVGLVKNGWSSHRCSVARRRPVQRNCVACHGVPVRVTVTVNCGRTVHRGGAHAPVGTVALPRRPDVRAIVVLKEFNEHCSTTARRASAAASDGTGTRLLQSRICALRLADSGFMRAEPAWYPRGPLLP
jgi:hypothetical protein